MVDNPYMDPTEYAQFFKEKRDTVADQRQSTAQPFRSSMPMTLDLALDEFLGEVATRREVLQKEGIRASARVTRPSADQPAELQVTLLARDDNLTLRHCHRIGGIPAGASTLGPPSRRSLQDFLSGLRKRLNDCGVPLRLHS